MAQNNEITILERDPIRGYGTRGISIELKANVFEVDVKNPDFCIYHYDVVIEKWFEKVKKNKQKQKDKREENEPWRVSKSMKRLVFQIFCEKYQLKNKRIDYDDESSAYSLCSIENIEAVINIKPENKRGASNEGGIKKDKRVHRSKHQFNVSLKHVSTINFRDLFDTSKTILAENQNTSPLQAANVMFHSHYAQTLYPIPGGRFFSDDGLCGSKTKSLGRGIMVNQGFFANLRPHGWKGEKLLMKLNVSYATFYESIPVIEFLKRNDIKVCATPLEGRPLKKANRIMKGLKIVRCVWYKTYDNKVVDQIQTHRVVSITEKGADELKFESENGEITVKDHTEFRKGDKLNYPSLNCLHVDNPQRTIWIPMEEAKIAKAQRAKVDLTKSETEELIKFATNKPKELSRKIMNIRHEGGFDNLAVIKDMGLKISNEMLKFDGRVIPPPELYMKQNRRDFRIIPENGHWNLFRNKVYKGVPLKNWVLLNYDKGFENSIRQFIDSVKKQGKYLGVYIEDPKYESCSSSSTVDFKKFKSQEVQLIICLMYEKSGLLYGQIKQAGDTHSGFLTQCLKTKTADDSILKAAVMQNIILQINAKLGGINYIINPDMMKFAEETIIMGADVNHPSPVKHKNDTVPPSFAAVVASYDEHATRYAGLRKTQKSRMEVSTIDDLKDMTKKLLKQYYKETKGKKPKRIIMYRDGVSETQFLKVLCQEMVAIRKACLELQNEYKPGITFICVQKRNQMRFFRNDYKMEENVPPGTVDDKNVTDKNLMDFYLVSHAGNKGTSRPCHYIVLWDDNGLHMDELQALTYNLCHLSPRTPKAISRPFPVLYAHELAYRGHILYKRLADSSDNSSSSSGSTDNDISDEDILSIELMDTDSILFKSMHCL